MAIVNETMNTTVNGTAMNVSNSVLGINLPVTGHPAFDLFIITLFVSLFITLVNKYLGDQVKIKALRKEMKQLQKDMKKVMAKDPKKAQKIQSEIFKKNMENMKHSMNPKILLFTMLPTLLIFGFVSKHYSVFGQFLNLGFTEFGWLGTYILFALINSILLKKVLDVA